MCGLCARRNTLGFLIYVPCQRWMSMDAQVLHPQLLTLAVMASGAWLTLALGLGGNAVALITLASQVRVCASPWAKGVQDTCLGLPASVTVMIERVRGHQHSMGAADVGRGEAPARCARSSSGSQTPPSLAGCMPWPPGCHRCICR